jgi:YHS domain-containing protein
MSVFSTSALAVGLILGVASTAYAATGEFGNMCSWGLANHKDVQTDCSINSEFRGKTYCFSSRESQTNFMKDPSANLAKAESFYKSEHKG